MNDPLVEIRNLRLFFRFISISFFVLIFILLIFLFILFRRRHIYGGTDIGKKRKKNEDFYIIKTLGNMSISGIFDGVGGEEKGERASKIAGEKFLEVFKSYLHVSDPISIIRKGYEEANRGIKRLKEQEGILRTATTGVVFLVSKGIGYYASVGDSRLYLLRDGELKRLTKDDSIVEILISHGEITEKEARHHPMKNVITKSIDGELTEFPEVKEIELKSKDIFLLCSDGLYDMVTEEKMKEILSTNRSIKYKVKKLIEEANSRGGKDNITLIIQEIL